MVGLALILVGLRIRNHKFGLLPVVAALMLAELVLRLFEPIDYRILVPLAFTLLTLNGLRGWWWLRRNAEPRGVAPNS